MTKKQKCYLLGIAQIIGGGVMCKYNMEAAGLALVAGGAYIIGRIQREWLPDPQPEKTP